MESTTTGSTSLTVNIYVAGGGRVGFHLARLLSVENHDVTVIDEAAGAFVAGEGDPLVTVGFDADAEPLALAYRPVTVETDPESGQRRMQVAAALLLGTDASLAEVAARVGYQSEFAFNRAFKREFGAPPAQYRRDFGAR